MSELPAPAAGWFEEGNALSREGRWADAVARFRRVLEVAPGHEWALNNLGYCLSRAGDHEEAVFRLRRTVAVAPRNPTAHANLIAALEAGGRGTEALPVRRQLADLRPKVAAHAFDLANALLGGGRAEEAIGYYQRALAVDPEYTPAVCNYLLALNYSDRWAPDAVAAEHVRLAARWAPRRPAPDQFPHTREPDRVLRVGYLSADFAQHPVGKLMIPVLAAHDRRAVTAFAYSDRADEDDWTRRVQAASGAFRPVGGYSDEDLLRLIREDRIDILVELNGYTGGRTRLGVFAAGAAPVQASFLGYPNTTGTRALDYRITDAFSDPPGPADRRYPEALVRLGRGFLCHTPPDDLPPLTPAPCVRAGFVTFGSFNNPSKVSEGALAAWVRVLRAVPRSRLVVKYGNKFADEGLRERWRDRFAAAGIDPGRLVFSPAVPGVAGHYRTIGAVDVALDSFPYQGTMTTLETLGMGVPVVTLLGDTTAGRASSALLMRLGLNEWVARDVDGYVAIASGLAADPTQLDALRPQVRARFLASEVCDVAGYVTELEGAYRHMWSRWCETAPAPDTGARHTAPGDTGLERAGPREPTAADRATVPCPPAGETTTVTLVDGVRVVVPNALDRITPYVLHEQHDWFEDEIKFLRGVLRPGQHVIDIGANYGTYALSMARAVGPDGHVWAFEPAPGTARLLAESIAANGFRQVTLERVALSNVRGVGRLSRNGQSELNALVPADRPPGTLTDAVRVAPLDDFLDTNDWREVAFVKMDAEGEEGNILHGGARFFAERSPLVQYEIKAGAALHLELVHRFAALGYHPYRLVPGLGLVAPFDPAAPVDGYLLNLFGCKPDTAAQLAARGLVVPHAAHPPGSATESVGPVGIEPVSAHEYRWHDALAGCAYAAPLFDRWGAGAGPPRAVVDALARYAASQDARRTAGERFHALRASFERFRALCEADPSPLRLASLARVARAFGARAVAVGALTQLDRLTTSPEPFEPAEPFLAPCARFDPLAPGERFRDWLRAAALEELERLEAFSSFYSSAHTQRRIETVRDLGFGCAEMERRLRLLKAVRSARLTAPGE